MRFLIVGGSGLISTPVSRLLLEAGHEVIHFNRGQTPDRTGGHLAGVQRLSGNRKDPAVFEATVRSVGRVDAVLDMICFTPEEMQSLIRAARGLTGHVLFCSTVDVYDRPFVRYPVTEDHPRHRTPTQYGRDKAKCEDLLTEAASRGDFAATVLRPAYTYNDGAGLLHSFGWDTRLFRRLREGLPVICHGDGTSLWPSCHADDIAPAFVRAMTRPSSEPVTASPVRSYNVAGEEWMSFADHYRTIARAIGAPEPRLVFIPSDLLARLAPARAGLCDMNFKYSNLFDNTAARRDLGFSCTISLETGAARSYEYLRSRGLLDERDDPEYDAVLEKWQRMLAAI